MIDCYGANGELEGSGGVFSRTKADEFMEIQWVPSIKLTVFRWPDFGRN